MDKIQWQAFEYEEKQRSTDWFWALGIIIVASSLTALIFKNYFFALLLIIGGLLLGFFAVKKPEIVAYELGEKGLKIKDRLFAYDTIKSFWVQADPKNTAEIVKPTLFIKSSRVFMPILSIPIDLEHTESIRAKMLSKNMIEEELQEHFSDRVMEYLGF